jgi:hypothetical protein
MAMNPELKYTAVTRYHWYGVEMWCVDNFGTWNEQWYRVHSDMAEFIDGRNPTSETYHFRTSEQAVLFALRWA